MHYRPLLPFLAALPLWASAQSTLQDVRIAAPLNALQGGWEAGAAERNAAQWQQAGTSAPANAAVQWNYFQSEYAAQNSRNGGVVGQQGREELAAIAGAIKADAPNSFERHMADYYVAFPAPSAFADLEQAYLLAPDRAELASPMLSMALRDGDAAAVDRWSAVLDRQHLIAPALAQVAADVLLCLPDKAVLFVNGEMDTQPLVVRQALQKVKPGVLVVDRRLLADSAYRARLWKQAGGHGEPPPDSPAFASALIAAGKLPVYFALSLARSWLDAFPGQLHATGAVFRVGVPSPADAAALARNWAAMAKPANAGPFSRNYLLPGAMLLKQVRQQGRTDEAARLEQELLRALADSTGTLGQLHQLGILPH